MKDPARYEEDSEVAKELLRQSPWDLLARYSKRDYVPPPGPAVAAVAAMEAWAGRLGDAADERRMARWMPSFAGVSIVHAISQSICSLS